MKTGSTAAPAATTDDPIIAAIAAFRAGCAEYSRLHVDGDGEDELADRTYGPALNVLDDWSEPALTHEGAMMALRFAAEELGLGMAQTAEPMVRAALAFFEEVA